MTVEFPSASWLPPKHFPDHNGALGIFLSGGAVVNQPLQGLCFKPLINEPGSHFIGRNGVQGEPATGFPDLSHMKHRPANLARL